MNAHDYGISRNTLKWLQSLDLSHPLKNLRRDLANGFMVAQLLSRYFPTELQLHSFDNSPSSAAKADNWQQIKKFLKKQGINIPATLLEGTEKGTQGAAHKLIESMYEFFTGKRIQPRINASEVYPLPISKPTTKSTPASSHGIPGLSAGSRMISSAPLMPAPKVEFSKVQVTQVEVDDIVSLRKQMHAANKAGRSFRLPEAADKREPSSAAVRRIGNTHVAEFKPT
eukprot:CAMPEP_0118935574 /NCGR_PEP_ID=MMETSP1169-20130426/15718_1 /TAXON_ID=36882 /ORGANISM="Pyramimonas obovata, Strain CCMP722" /LENGTH=226 /DNA_ID=CAMNT_0006878625 /DNA_START=251 /DNA_END=927 /DNA_ORIENTATION=+